MAPRDDDEPATPPSRTPGLLSMLVGLGLRQASRLPDSLTRLPLTGLGVAMLTVETVRREIEEARRRGGGVLQLGAGVVHAAMSLRQGGESVVLRDEESVDAEAAQIARDARETSTRALSQAKDAARESAAATARASEQAREVGAPGAATAVAERVTRQVHRSGEAEALGRDELPIPDFDNATLGSLRGRLRTLTVEQLVVLRDYERAHGNRLPVVTMLENRMVRVQGDATKTTGVSP